MTLHCSTTIAWQSSTTSHPLSPPQAFSVIDDHLKIFYASTMSKGVQCFMVDQVPFFFRVFDGLRRWVGRWLGSRSFDYRYPACPQVSSYTIDYKGAGGRWFKGCCAMHKQHRFSHLFCYVFDGRYGRCTDILPEGEIMLQTASRSACPQCLVLQ